jgi:hypothetical protein
MRVFGSLILLAFSSGCGRAPTLEDCRTRGTAEHELVGRPCDGPDADACTEGVWQCSEAGVLSCDDQSVGTRELCNGVDDDCDGRTDPGCGCAELLTPPDCDADGDGLPPRSCAPPALSGGETVACVCPAPPCADVACQQSFAEPQAALDALSPLAAPTSVWVFAGEYPGFTTSKVSSSALAPLRVAAHCPDGERAAAVLRGPIIVADDQITLEGFRIDLGDLAATAVRIDDTADGGGGQVTLRALTITGEALSTAREDAYVFAEAVQAAVLDGLVIEEVEIYGGAAGSRNLGILTDGVDSVVVRRTSVCRLDTPGEDVGLYLNGTGHLVDRYLGREVDVGAEVLSAGYVVDESLFTGCRVAGVVTNGYDGTIKNSRFVDNQNGLLSADVANLLVFDNLFARNAGYGAQHARTDACCGTQEGFYYNTFAGNGATGLTLEGLLARELWGVSGNLFAGHVSAGSVAFQTINYEVTTAVANLFSGNAIDCACSGAACTSSTDCQNDTPLLTGSAVFVDGPGGLSFLLAQAPEQANASAAVDAGDDDAAAACLGGTCLSQRTTSTAFTPDSGPADLGFHHPLCP